MPELPELFNLAEQMRTELSGKKITDVDVRQSKCLNVSQEEFESLVRGKTVKAVTSRGKWVVCDLEAKAFLFLSLGMGGNVLLHREKEALPEKYQLKLGFHDHTFLTIAFSWFGYAHAVSADRLSSHSMTAKLGLTPIRDPEFTVGYFNQLLKGRKSAVKSFLLDQHTIAGIGNVYIHDILFGAHLHPNRKISDLSDKDRKLLYDVIIKNLSKAIRLGGLAYERDLYNKPGRFKDFEVGYREDQPCPSCGTPIKKIRTGGTASFVCLSCQKL